LPKLSVAPQPLATKGEPDSAYLARRSFLREHGLTLAFTAFFAIAMVGQTIAGFGVLNDELVDHGRRALSMLEYLGSGHFIEATFENWESEFLQMGLFVVLTIHLRQRGSSESKPMDGSPHAVDADPRLHEHDPDAPWPVRRSGLPLWIYSRSLTLAFAVLFFASFGLHAYGGMLQSNLERSFVGKAPESFLTFLLSSQFWFQSMQNWQSEFLSVAALVVLSIYLRQQGSSQSKPVAAPHDETGE